MYGIRPSCRRRRIGTALLLTLALSLPALGDSIPDLEQRLAAARDALSAGQPGKAESLYRELIAADPQQVAPYSGLAEIYLARGRPDAAVTLILPAPVLISARNASNPQTKTTYSDSSKPPAASMKLPDTVSTKVNRSIPKNRSPDHGP